MLSQGEISAGLKHRVTLSEDWCLDEWTRDKSPCKSTYLRASKDILPVLYGSSFSSNALLVKDFLMLEVLLLEEDLANK